MNIHDTARLIQLRKCVLLRREYESAIFRMAEMMDGIEHVDLPAHEVKFLNDQVGVLNDGADDPSDIDENALADIEHDWNMQK